MSVLAVASFAVHAKVSRTAAFERNVLLAQSARSVVFRLALNEESGVRGYTSTGEREFLRPYDVSRRRMPVALARLDAAIATVGLSAAEPFARSERRLNDEWISRYAIALIADPNRSARTLALQRGAKARVDEIRVADRKLQQIFNAAAERGEDDLDRAISSILVFNVVALGALTFAGLAFSYLQFRAARLAFESRLLYENEKRLADAFQEAFLQKALPLMPGVGLHATYVPASREAQVGGDWYDAFELPDKSILFSIGDVAGHGIDAAVVMNRARQAIVSAALHDDDPATVLERANRSLLLQNSRMVTAICGYIDPRTREIVYATAGHPPPVMARPNERAAFLPHEGLPLGIVPDAAYATFRTQAPPGGMLVLYTDGVLEHKRDIVAGQNRLLEAAARAVGGADPALAIQRHVFSEAEPTDDVAILVVSFLRVEGDGGEVPVVDAFAAGRWRADRVADVRPREDVDIDGLPGSDVAAAGPEDRESTRVE